MTDPYKWVGGYDIDHVADEYDVLVRSDGTEVTILTEPEDRYPYRDIAPITAELNTLATELAAKDESLRIATEALDHYANERTWERSFTCDCGLDCYDEEHIVARGALARIRGEGVRDERHNAAT